MRKLTFCFHPRLRSALLAAVLGGVNAQPAPDPVAPTSSYLPVKIEEPFDAIERRMEQAKPGIMQAHLKLLAERYDPANRPADGVTKPRG